MSHIALALWKSNSSLTGNRNLPAICSKTSKLGALMPRSIRLRKSTLVTDQFRKLLLGEPSFLANRLQPDSKLLPER